MKLRRCSKLPCLLPKAEILTKLAFCTLACARAQIVAKWTPLNGSHDIPQRKSVCREVLEAV